MGTRRRSPVSTWLALMALGMACRGGGAWDALFSEGTSALGRKDFRVAEERLRAAVEAAKPFGPADQRLINSYYSLALVYEQERRLAEAEEVYRTVLGLREQVLRPDDPMLVTSLKRLAQVYEAEGKAKEAAPLRARIHKLQAGGAP